MRRPVSVKVVLLCPHRVFFFQPSRLCRPPSIRTLGERCIRSVQVGCSRFSRCCYLISDLASPSRESGPGLGRSHLNSAVELGCRAQTLFLPGFSLCRWAHRLPAVAQRFVHLAAYPQSMQQHRQLARDRYHRSFLGVFPSSLRQLEPPAPQITILSKRSQNVMGPLHQKRP
jgi:hypothetical protein